MAAALIEEAKLLFGFDTFGDNLKFHVMRQSDDGGGVAIWARNSL